MGALQSGSRSPVSVGANASLPHQPDHILPRLHDSQAHWFLYSCSTEFHVSPPEPRAPAVERYDGSLETRFSFVTLCSLTFELQAFTFATDHSKVAFIITNLNGRVREWAMVDWERRSWTMILWLLFMLLWVRFLANCFGLRSSPFSRLTQKRNESLIDTFYLSLS